MTISTVGKITLICAVLNGFTHHCLHTNNANDNTVKMVPWMTEYYENSFDLRDPPKRVSGIQGFRSYTLRMDLLNLTCWYLPSQLKELIYFSPGRTEIWKAQARHVLVLGHYRVTTFYLFSGPAVPNNLDNMFWLRSWKTDF